MRYVLTLVADRPGPPVAPQLPELAEAVLQKCSLQDVDMGWLAPERAFDVFFNSESSTAVKAALDDIDEHAIDVAVQPAEGRRKRLLVADLESTIIRNEMLDELAELAGCRAEVENLTAEAMNGELDFPTALRRRVRLLEGLPLTALDQAAEKIELMPGAATLIATLRQHRAVTALLTSGVEFFAERIRERLGFTWQRSNKFEVADGKLTGRVDEPIFDREGKRHALEELCRQNDLALSETMAVGDGANDLPMLQRAGLGVAFHAKPQVVAQTRCQVRHGDLSTLLFFQGYRADEIVR